MEGITLIVAAVASTLVLFLSPLYGLIMYIAALVWYPSYLSVKVGTIDFTVCRIVILAIYANLFLRTKLPYQFKLIWLDKFVIIYFLAQIVAGVMTSPSLEPFIENRAGAVFDMVLPYFAVRMIVTNKKDYLTVLRGILLIAAPLACFGFYQSLTGYNVAGFLGTYGTVARFGFYRANVTFSVHIMFGLFFAMCGTVCAGLLRNIKGNKLPCIIGIGLMGIGVFSSVSFGPLFGTMLAVFFIALFHYRHHWKAIAAVILGMCILLEIVSNRHFFEVIDRFAFSSQTAWYRSRLIQVALFEGGMSGHWLFGYGYGIEPGWCRVIDGRSHTWIVNHYLLVLSRFGLVGFIPFFAMNIAVVKRLVDAYRASTLETDQWLVWCLSASLFGLAGVLFSVSLFGQSATIFYILLGFCGAMPAIVETSNTNVVKSSYSMILKPIRASQSFESNNQ